MRIELKNLSLRPNPPKESTKISPVPEETSRGNEGKWSKTPASSAKSASLNNAVHAACNAPHGCRHDRSHARSRGGACRHTDKYTVVVCLFYLVCCVCIEVFELGGSSSGPDKLNSTNNKAQQQNGSHCGARQREPVCAGSAYKESKKCLYYH